MKVALVYDRINKWGGAERVLLALHELFPDAPLYTSVCDLEKAPWARIFDIRSSFLQKLPRASSSHESYVVLMPIAFESFSFDEYDLVISLTSEAAKGIITKPGTFHICYCLTPTRYLWSGYKDYFKNPLFRFLSKPAVSYLRSWDSIACQRPDAYLAISSEVQKRIKTYYNRESIVIYPPVEILDSREFTLKGNSNLKKKDESSIRNGFFLIVSRLVPYKRIDIAIEAFNKLKLPLKIAGVGSEEKRLRSMAGSTIEFLGNLTDKQLVEYYRTSSALIFPAHEDLGLVVLEAQSFGKPVIAFKGGGALETVIDGETGKFFYPQNAESLISVLRDFQSLKFDVNKCRKQAEGFSKQEFKKQFASCIDLLLL